MLLEFTLVQLFIQSVIEFLLFNEVVELQLQLVIELLQSQLVSDLHLIAERLHGDFEFCLVDQLLRDGQVMLLHVDLYLCQQFLDLDKVACVLAHLLLRDHGLAE